MSDRKRDEFYGPMRRSRYQNKQKFDDYNDMYGYKSRDLEVSTSDLHPNVQFLISCGVHIKHASSLPMDLLNIMTPEECGVCHLTLRSLSECSNHYSSRSHYKKQKKFLKDDIKDKSKMDYFQVRETYCELCDLELLSSSHASSHYSGKSHNEIVFYQKPPKNKALLAPDMLNRLKYLIESESMLCQYIKKTEVPKNNAAVKNCQPLLCKICNVYVSTQAEMVIHFNGKKHLKKEKLLIFESLHNEESMFILFFNYIINQKPNHKEM